MEYMEKASRVTGEVQKVIIGKDDCIRKVMMALLAQGHVLIEDIPGVGKTTLALAFARAMHLKQGRVQFTPDVLPSDITGFSMLQKDKMQFVYQPGAVMCNLFLADEINRTSSRTQSALLEVMEERAVTVDGVTHPVPSPFLVIATENPIGSAGTQMLPESQLDRFMISIVMGYPARRDEVEILMEQSEHRPMDQIEAVISAEELAVMQEEVRSVFVHKVVYEYIVALADATRNHPMAELGLSPRGSLAVSAMARAAAYMRGRDYVLPDDVADIFGSVARHRIRVNTQARLAHKTAEQIVEEVLRQTKKPKPEQRR